jgi:uncharacterized protein (TIRG00374 family)
MKRALAFLVSFSILGYLLYSANVPKVLAEISHANLAVYALAFLITPIILGVKAIRWRLMLSRIGIDLPFTAIFKNISSGILLSSLTPGRAGEPVRAYLLKKSHGTSFTKVMPTIVVERIMDMFTIILFALAGLFFFPVPSEFYSLLTFTISFVLFCTIIVLVLCFNRGLLEGFLNFFFRFFMKSRRGEMNKILDNFYSGISCMRSKSLVLTLVSMSVLSWLVEVFIPPLVALSLGYSLGLGESAFAISISVLVGLASFLPGGLGSAEAVMAYMLSLIFGTLSAGTAVTFLYRVSTLYFTCTLGAIFLATSRNKI